MPGPRANFECRKCQKTIEDLPIDSTRCPICGFKRGFRRLFDAINVSTKGHAAAAIIDECLPPMIAQRDAIRASAANVPAPPPSLQRQPAKMIVEGLPGHAKRASSTMAFPLLPVVGGTARLLQSGVNPFFTGPRPLVVASHTPERK